MNKVCMLGRLGHDPEIRFTQSGKQVARLNVAINRHIKDKKITDWFEVVAWEKNAELIGNAFKKGDLIAFEGRLETRMVPIKDTNKERRLTYVHLATFDYIKPKAVEEEYPQPFGGTTYPDDEVPM